LTVRSGARRAVLRIVLSAVLGIGLAIALGATGGRLAAAQEEPPDGAPAGATGETRAIEATVLDVDGEVRGIVGLTSATAGGARKIDARVTDVEGAMRDLGARVSETEIRIELSADVLFDFDKADLRPDAVAALGKAGAIVQAHPKAPVTIEGHTDSKGADAYNQKLSERRAAAVAKWLVANAGVNGERLTARGLGETRPVVPNEGPGGKDDPAGRQKNRRVEIVVRRR
jgi:outer membrane protein OmpA-like peptidoglycan-associated protein